jgi:hypothetical protein
VYPKLLHRPDFVWFEFIKVTTSIILPCRFDCAYVVLF